MNTRQCRHIRKLQMRAMTTIQHKAIAGATRADELDELTQLCPICSGMIVSMLMFIEADDVEEAKRQILATLAVAN
jgi:hypothetical protein